MPFLRSPARLPGLQRLCQPPLLPASSAHRFVVRLPLCRVSHLSFLGAFAIVQESLAWVCLPWMPGAIGSGDSFCLSVPFSYCTLFKIKVCFNLAREILVERFQCTLTETKGVPRSWLLAA